MQGQWHKQKKRALGRIEENDVHNYYFKYIKGDLLCPFFFTRFNINIYSTHMRKCQKLSVVVFSSGVWQ